MIQNFAKELLACVVFDQIVLIAMQTLFTDFNVSRHAKDELFEALTNSVLNDCVVFSVDTDALDYCNIYNP